jgi:hypothetical protein
MLKIYNKFFEITQTIPGRVLYNGSENSVHSKLFSFPIFKEPNTNQNQIC